MKKNNAILAGVAVVALAAAMVPAAMAENVKTTDTTTVKYEVTAGYEWSVPSVIDFAKDKGVNQTSSVTADADTGDTQKVQVTKNIIPDGETLRITMAGTGGAFEIKNGETTLTYTVTKNDTAKTAIASGGEVLSVAAGTNTGDQDLIFTLKTGTGTAEVAGKYEGTITYTAAVGK